jgi:transposase, IS5 family
MIKQTSFSVSGFSTTSRTTRKQVFLAKMDKLMPWAAIEALIEPHYPKAGNGRPPKALSQMLRMYCIANWYNLADEACEEALYDTACLREFCGIDLGPQNVPDATTLLGFRHLLERHQLGAAIFAQIGQLLQDNGLQLSGGTLVDATIIAAPSSTKNQAKQRDGQMHSTRKGGQYHFGMKVHTGVDSKSGLVHSASVTAANVHDSQQLEHLLHGQEGRVYGDSAYTGQKHIIKECAPQAKDYTQKRAWRNKALSEQEIKSNRRKSSVRAKVEHPFLTLKRIWGFAKVRYRGLEKNANRAFAMLAMYNVQKWGKPLMA